MAVMPKIDTRRPADAQPGAPSALFVAGLDPSGGAGLQADIETAAALGARAHCALSCNTLQDSRGVAAVAPGDAAFLARQIACVLSDFDIAAVKLGLLATRDNIAAVARALAAVRAPIVVDPVLAAGGDGAALCEPGCAAQLRERLLPLAALATPNLSEAMQLVPAAATPDEAARALLAEGCGAVLITDVKPDDAVVEHRYYTAAGAPKTDTLAAGSATAGGPRKDDDKPSAAAHSAAPRCERLQCARLPGAYHGSGCTLSAAIAALLARGCDAREAARRAQDFVCASLQAAEWPGRGQGFAMRRT